MRDLGHVGAHHDDVAVDEAEHVADLARADRRQSTPAGDGDGRVPGGPGRAGHGHHVVVEPQAGVVHRDCREGLDDGPRRDHGDAHVLPASLLGGRLRHGARVLVAGQDDDFGRVREPDRAEDLRGRRSLARGSGNDEDACPTQEVGDAGSVRNGHDGPGVGLVGPVHHGF